MARYRQIETRFWSDSKVIDDMTPEDRYFYLYLLTNEKSNQVGCYEISKNQICRDTGYDKERIEKLIKRFEEDLDLIIYDENTKEIFIKNWYKYNWLKSNKTLTCVIQGVSEIKSEKIMPHISPLLQNYLQNMPHTSNKEKEEEKEKEKEESLEKEEEWNDPFGF